MKDILRATWDEREKNKLQAEIDGVIRDYKACSREPLEEAKSEYKKAGWTYIGSSNVYYVNGVRNESNKVIHFFA